MGNYDFRQAAQKALANSPLQAGKTKKQWTDVDGTEVTIIAFDQNDGPEVKDGKVVVNEDTGEVKMVPYTTVLLSEYPNNYFGGFDEIDRMLASFMQDFESYSDLNEKLLEAGGLKIRTKMVLKNGKNSRKIEIL